MKKMLLLVGTMFAGISGCDPTAACDYLDIVCSLPQVPAEVCDALSFICSI
ncbi:MAG: hypothetical protein JXQ73_05590 [Phycisphaerae bacterium]|nr:hypothetical protein [Phycisphaerae bacterium]